MINVQREKMLKAHIDKHIREGGTLIFMGWGVINSPTEKKWVYAIEGFKGKCGCPLSCLIVGMSTKPTHLDKRYYAARVMLECSQEWIFAFVAGFDQCGYSYKFNHEERLAFALGRNLHKEYKPIHSDCASVWV